MLKETSKLVFNTSKLTLGQAKVSSPTFTDDIVVPSSKIQLNEKLGRGSIDLPTLLPAGAHVRLRIDFAGELTGSMVGYYRSAWEDEGETKYYALTQFQVSNSVHLASNDINNDKSVDGCSKDIPLLGRAASQSLIRIDDDISCGHG